MLDICNNVLAKYPEIQSDIKTNNQKTDLHKKRAKYEREAYDAYIKLLKAGKPADPALPPVPWVTADPKLVTNDPDFAALDHQNLDNSAPQTPHP
jgi:hypothetical protein